MRLYMAYSNLFITICKVNKYQREGNDKVTSQRCGEVCTKQCPRVTSKGLSKSQGRPSPIRPLASASAR